MTENLLTIREMCESFDVTPRTLRFYGPREIARMTLILRGRRFGFSLEEMRQWLLIYNEDGTEAQMRKWVDMAGVKVEELQEQREQLDTIIDELIGLRDKVAKTLG